jgi:hypothetical protein
VKGDNQVIDGRRKGAQETLAVFKRQTDGNPPQSLLQLTDEIVTRFPEVDNVCL